MGVLTDKLSPGARRILGNTSWLLADRVLQMAVGLVVGVWMARYLGPGRFGDFNCAMALVSLVVPMTSLGIQGIAVRDAVRDPTSKDELLGTALVLRLAGGVLGYAVVLVAAWIVYADQPVVRYMAIVVGASLLFRAFDTADFWFQAEVKSRYTVIAKSTAMLGSSVGKVWLILLQAPVASFAWMASGEIALGSLLVALAYRLRSLSISAWRFAGGRAVYLLGQSWPLIISSFGATLNLEIDKVMLGRMAGSAEAGVYSAAARLSETWYFIPVALASSVFPALVRSKEADEKVYGQRMQRLLDTMVWMALAVIVVVSPLSHWIVGLLYGPKYRGAASILTLHVWACLFTFMGAALSKWLVNEGLLRFSFTRHGFGALMNIVLNLFLIPRYGGMGAAISTLISYATSNWLACFTSRSTVPAGAMMALALLAPVRSVARLLARARRA